ncbi:hypothetical protein AAC387_Pa08g0533 [Persea americana]
MAVKSFQQALRQGIELRVQLVMYPVATMKEAMAWANRFIRAEEDEVRGWVNFGLTQKDRPSKGDNRSSKREDRRRNPSPDRRRASSLDRRRAPSTSAAASGSGRKSRREAATFEASKFCTYHKQNGHITDECKAIKAHLENLVKEGHLRDYIKEEGRDNSRLSRRDDGGQYSEPEGIINVIHLAPPPKGSSQARAEAKRASHQKQRVLVDPGSSSEIIYYDCFKKLKLKDEDLQTAHTPLIGFSSKPVYPKGKIPLRVQEGGASKQVDFLVVDVPSPYNVIMRMTWLHSMEAVPSTRHQKLKFPLEN